MTCPDKYDVIVVGGGAGGLTAACTAAVEGCSVALLEQADVVGGTTAISGGMIWIPANHKMASCGRSDSLETARTYLAHTVPGNNRGRLESFLAHGEEAVRYLEEHTNLRLQPVPTYPDYYPDLPGATLGARVLEPEPFDARVLGKHFSMLRGPLPEFMLFNGMMISRADIPHLRRAGRSLRSALYVTKLLLHYALQRLQSPRGTTLYLGNALVGRLLQSALRLGVQIHTGCAVQHLLQENGRVAGVEVQRSGNTAWVLQARKAVILATGGLSHGEQRANYVPAVAGTLTATVDPGGAARGAWLAQQLGATLSPPTESGAFWVPASTFRRHDGSMGVYPHTVTDRGKPGLIAVDRTGRRFVNEARSYHEFVRAQLASNGVAVPAYLICDRRFLWKYGLGRVKPFSLSVAHDIADGYLRRADTVAGLAKSLGIPEQALAQTVTAYNEHARRGEDPAFGKGGDAYQRYLGDGDQTPNPCVAPIEHAPFYAVAVHPADLGMSAGIQTDATGRVLDTHDTPIAGLYACGNDMASVMEGAYPGPGITLGPALTFGYLAGRDAACAPSKPQEGSD